jgi:hypothetical protein
LTRQSKPARNNIGVDGARLAIAFAPAVLASTRHWLSDVLYWLGSHRLAVVFVVILVAVAGVGAYVIARDDESATEVGTPAAPQVVVPDAPAAEETDDLGFPAFATKNTTRVAGPDPVVNAAGVALAVHPSSGGVEGPSAVTLVDADDWAGAVAAASLTAAPVGAPLLVTQSRELPDLTRSALRALDPQGSAETAGRQAFVVGDAAKPEELESLELGGAGPAEEAAEIDRLRERLADEPDHVLLASSQEPAYSMPAAAWAARSGDPVLFVERDRIPKATAEALRGHQEVPVYVLGPESVISADVMKQVKRLFPTAERVGAGDPVSNSIAFARYASGSFGWNINDPGHGLVIASADRPLDGAVAAPLSASGTWGPLLVSTDGDDVPAALRGYLLDLKPGYENDPTRAVYNHVWLIGDTGALSVDFQAQVDELAEVAPVSSGTGGDSVAPPPGTPESSPPDGGTKKDERK